MTVLMYLIPAALFLGLVGLVTFLWAMKTGQFDDLDGAAHRILFEDDDPNPSPKAPETHGDSSPDDGSKTKAPTEGSRTFD